MKESSTVGHEKMKKLLEFYCHLLEFYCRALEFYCPVFLVIFKTGVLMSLESYCRWGSTVECNYIFFKYLKNWGSIVVGVLLFLEFFCLWSSTVSIPTPTRRELISTRLEFTPTKRDFPQIYSDAAKSHNVLVKTIKVKIASPCVSKAVG